MDNTQSAAELRRSWLRGVRVEDVDEALDELGQRNRELAGELAAAEEKMRELVERVTSAEQTLVAFHAGFEHVGTLLSQAEERARETTREAEAQSLRLSVEAQERVRAAEAELAALTERKRETLDSLMGLGARLTALNGQGERHAEEPAPESRRLTVADLLALEAEGRL